MTDRAAALRVLAATLLMCGAAGSVCAQTVQSQNPNAFSLGGPASIAARKSLQWDTSGKWTLNLDMDQQVGRELALKDVSAGAFFHITPSVRIGGSVGLADRF